MWTGAKGLLGQGKRLRLPLHSRRRITLFLLAVFAPGVALLAGVAKAALAATWGGSWQIPVLERAIALDGGNPELHFNLGTLYLWAEGGNPEAAAAELRQATRLNPRVAAYWSALAKACYAAGQAACSDQAFERAAQLSPAKPRAAWEAALHYVVTGRPQPAWAHARRLLRLEPGRGAQVCELMLRATGSPEAVWRQLARPGDERLRLQCLGVLLAHSEVAAAERFWEELAGAGMEPAPGFVEQLLRGGHYQAAARVATRLGGSGALRAGGPAELIFNGGFEQAPSQAGFDWHLEPQKFLALDLDQGARGGRALRVEFTAPQNSDCEAAYQFVPVVSGNTYRLTASVRSENITSDSGPQLLVAAPQCPACLRVATPATSGTSGWHQVEARFTAPAEVQLLRISLYRRRSRSFPAEISGRFWLDDVSLRPVASLPAPRP